MKIFSNPFYWHAASPFKKVISPVKDLFINRTFAQSNFKKFLNFNFKKQGIGGLDKEVSEIVNKAFLPRLMPKELSLRYGVEPAKGVLLYGSPGTGKTLIARHIADLLERRKVKVINGPELFDRFVGNSQKNVRGLFAEAQAEWAERGEESDLHVLILDEIDALCQKRGGQHDSAGVYDSVLTQFLTMIDGVDVRSNIFIMGLTNRRDRLDEALLRSGRLGLQVHIPLPDEAGRHDILNIHTAHLQSEQLLAKDVDLAFWAKKSQNFSGADLKALVEYAKSNALQRNFTLKPDKTLELQPINKDAQEKVRPYDFEQAFERIRPLNSLAASELQAYGPCALYSEELHRIYNTAIQQLALVEKAQKAIPPLGILLHGRVGVGKTTLAVRLAKDANAPFLSMLTAGQLISLSASDRAERFDALHAQLKESRFSIVLLDDIASLRHCEVTCIKIRELLTRPLPHNCRLAVIATAEAMDQMAEMRLGDLFSSTLAVPKVSNADERDEALVTLGARLGFKSPLARLPVRLPLRQHIHHLLHLFQGPKL